MVVWTLGLKKPGLTDRGVTTGVTKFRIVFGGLRNTLYFVPVVGLLSMVQIIKEYFPISQMVITYVY